MKKLAILTTSLLLVGAGCFSKPAPVPPPEPEPTGDASRLMPPSEPGTSLYTNSAYDLMLYHPDAITPLTDHAEMTATGYIPACDPEIAIACFPYGKIEYAGTNFETAAFAIHLRADLSSEAACMAAGNGEEAAGMQLFNGQAYAVFSFGDAAAGHQLSGENYRAFHEGNCIELSTRIGTTTYENYEPGTIKRFTDDDRAAVKAVLDKMRASFRFQNDLELL